MRRCCWLAVGAALLLALVLWDPVLAGELEDTLGQDAGPWVGLVSTEVECLAVQAGGPNRASATVHLRWEGQIEEAFLMLSVAGSQGGHSVYVNGRRIGSAPVRLDGPACRVESPVRILAPTDKIPVPANVLREGVNVITLTNDADVNDAWTAANLYLEIYGSLSGPPVAVLEHGPPVLSHSTGAMTPLSGTVLLTSTYELAQGQVISQLVSYQIPVSYTGSVPVPLLVGIHGMGSDGWSMRGFLAPEANSRGWLLAAPDMHGMVIKNSGKDALAWVGAQYDIIDTLEYVIFNHNVDLSRIYITGESMGGQTTTVMASKYPDVFAAAAEWMGFTDLTDWYYDLENDPSPWNLRERIEIETGGTPLTVPFEYQRRSAMRMSLNSRRVPLTIWHNVPDQIVPIYHARDLRDAINGSDPPTPVMLYEVNACTDRYGHCYEPDLEDLYQALENFALSSQPPPSVTIRTDESKLYHWLSVAQTGGDHWSEVEAGYNLADKTVTVTVSDTRPLTLAFNLGSTPVTGRAGISRPGIGLPATTYLINGGGSNRLEDYTSGYLTTTLATTGRFTLTISAVKAELSADPAMVSGWQTTTATITAVCKDYLNNPPPDGTIARFSTTEGTFPNGRSVLTATIAGGQVTTTLALTPTTPAVDLAEITVSLQSAGFSTSIAIIHPAIDVLVIPTQTLVDEGQTVTYTYQLTNSGDITLTGVLVVDDNGTPGEDSDDLTICADLTLTAGASQSCGSRSAVLNEDTTSTATATGRDPLGRYVSVTDSTTVAVTGMRLYLPLVVRSI